jgi:dipeptidyl aminopeptidase/acylaminoacyl peptidase
MRKVLPWLAILLIACSALATPVVVPTATVGIPTATVVTSTPSPTPTLAPYEQYTIDYLRKRTYGGGKIEVTQKLAETDLYDAYAIRYPSDGLNIYGYMTVPKGTGPFPIIVSVHGYAANGTYDPFNIEYDFGNLFAENQFIVLHPGMRNQPPSDHGDNLLRVGMTEDVLNLIALIRAKNDLPPELTSANPDALGLWGTSMGGEIALRILTIRSDVKATVLYSAMSGDERKNAEQLYHVIQDGQFKQDEQVPIEMFDRISPANYYYRVKSAVQINHGTADTTAPISWAVETCNFLKAAGVYVECIYYPGASHLFGHHDRDKLIQNVLQFYKINLAQ